MAGVPIAIKDNMCQNGVLTTCASKILSNFVPTYTSDAVVKLMEAGAVIVGKTNMDEFAMGSTTETSYYGETKNPWNTNKFRVVLPVDQQPLLQQKKYRVHSVPIPVDRSASRQHFVV